jgi:uncharacterized protein YggT (Ycf19 family)
MNPIIYLINIILELINFGLFFYILMQILIQFKKLDINNPAVKKIWESFYILMEPILNVVRKKFPQCIHKGFDFSPIIVFITISFVKYTINYFFA